MTPHDYGIWFGNWFDSESNQIPIISVQQVNEPGVRSFIAHIGEHEIEFLVGRTHTPNLPIKHRLRKALLGSCPTVYYAYCFEDYYVYLTPTFQSESPQVALNHAVAAAHKTLVLKESEPNHAKLCRETIFCS